MATNGPHTTHPWLVAWAMLAGAFAPMVGLAFLVESWPYWLSVPLGCPQAPCVVVLSVSHYLALIAFAFLAGMLLASLIIGTVAGKVGL